VTITCNAPEVESASLGARGNPGRAREERREIVAKPDNPPFRLLRVARPRRLLDRRYEDRD
jgi:hypothetical protein